MDVVCAKCGEPWDAYGVRNGDMEEKEAARFLKGEGCPCCGFGSRCPHCDGTGIDTGDYPHTCKTCNDKSYVLAWSPTRSVSGYIAGRLYTGYSPSVRALSEDVYDNIIHLGVRTLPERFGRHESRDGWVEEWWAPCPEGCATKEHTPCPECDGTGALTPSDGMDLAAAESEINASDEDGVEILARRGLI